MNYRQLTRRSAAAAIVFAPAVLRSAHAQAPSSRPTPSQTEGPFYPVELPADSDFDLLRNGTRQYTRGQAAWVEGTVADLAGKPVSQAVVEIWQCDEDGHYHHPGDGGRADPAFQGFGRVTAGADGRYRFRTLKPVPYTGRTPHIHFKVKLASRTLLTTQMYVEGEPRNERDGIWRHMTPADRALVTAAFRRDGDSLRAEFPIRVQA